MKNYFLNYNQGLNYSFFSPIYFILIIILFLIIKKINSNKIKIKNIKNIKYIRIIIGLFFIVVMLLRRLSFILFGVYNWKYHLDINFCSMTNIIFIIYCFTGNKTIYKLCYYLIFSGPLLAIICPSINTSIFNYSFVCFIIMHHVIFVLNYIFLVYNNLKFNYRDILKSYVFIIIFVNFTYLFNFLFNTNYNTLNSFLNKEIDKIFLFKNITNNDFISNLFLVFINFIFLYIGVKVMKKNYIESGEVDV